jgi:hypothetical protein
MTIRHHPARLTQHRQGSHWFVEIAKVTIEAFPTLQAALAAEAKAIREEKPLHNIAGKPKPPKRPKKPTITILVEHLRAIGKHKAADRLAKSWAGWNIEGFTT